MLIVQNFNRSLGFIDAQHFHKAVAFGFVSVLVVNNLDGADGTDAFEQFLDVRLGGVIRQVSDVEACGLDVGEGWLAAFAWGARRAGLTCGTTFATLTSIARVGAWCLLFGPRTALGAWALKLGLALSSFGLGLGAFGGFFVEPNQFEDFLPERQFDGLAIHKRLMLRETAVVIFLIRVVWAVAVVTTAVITVAVAIAIAVIAALFLCSVGHGICVSWLMAAGQEARGS